MGDNDDGRKGFGGNSLMVIKMMVQLKLLADTGLFGVSLETLLSRDCKKIPSLRVPLFVVLVSLCGADGCLVQCW